VLDLLAAAAASDGNQSSRSGRMGTTRRTFSLQRSCARR
jgi:hypothetical protein